MLQNRLRFVLLNSFWHHVIDVFDDCSPEFEIILAFNPLLGHALSNSFRVPSFELPGKQVPEPSLKKGNDSTDEKQPNAPTRGPEAYSWAFANLSGIEPVVDQVFEVLSHSDLAHQAILVSVHAGKMSNMREYILQSISELECFDVPKSILHMRVHNKLD
jgi:hypothetical protein